MACERHAGQVDKAGQDYIQHPLRVMENVQQPHAKICAVLHDILEDTPTTIDELKVLGFEQKIIDAIKHPELALFRDEPIYEDLNLKLPALKVFNAISQRVEELIYKHGIHYWSFSATSTKKANVYEKLLKRWMSRNTMAFKYDRVGNDFYVYVENNFND